MECRAVAGAWPLRPPWTGWGTPSFRSCPYSSAGEARKTTFWMAQQLGFVVIDMGIQFADKVGEEELLEVRSALHFHDLAHGRG